MIWTFTCRKAVCGKMRFSYNYKNGKEEIICYSSMNDFDGISYGIMQDERKLFLPVEVSEEAGKYVFTYNMLGMVNLRAWMNDASRSEQREMKQEIAEMQRKLFHMGILENQLITEERYMYVDEQTAHIRFICVPATMEKRIETPPAPASSVPPVSPIPPIPSIPPVPTEDIPDTGYDFGSEGLKYPGFLQEPDGNEKKEEQAEEAPSDENGTILDETFREKAYGNENITYGEPSGWIDTISEPITTEISDDSDDIDMTIPLKEEPDEGEEETVLLVPKFKIDASLYRNNTGEIFQINKERSVIGKSETRADIVIRDNKTVSRAHCIISVEDREYYLEDNNSLNGTYLEDKKLQSDEKVRIQDGSRVRLSDEEFIFHINE